MIEVIKQQFEANMTTEEKINRVREFLQILTLKIVYDKNYFDKLAFEGGTALRILYNIGRFSEDLDFSLIDKNKWDISHFTSDIETEFKLRGLKIESKIQSEDIVQSVFVKFVGLLNELALSHFSEQKLSIKLEIDINPPQGANIETTFITRLYMFNLTHFDLSSMFAKKIHACFFRKYTKGRDFYDLIWYLGKNIYPNFQLLNNAIRQTENQSLNIDKNNLKKFLL